MLLADQRLSYSECPEVVRSGCPLRVKLRPLSGVKQPCSPECAHGSVWPKPYLLRGRIGKYSNQKSYGEIPYGSRSASGAIRFRPLANCYAKIGWL